MKQYDKSLKYTRCHIKEGEFASVLWGERDENVHAQETRRSSGCSMCQLGESAKPVRLWGLNARAEETHWEEAFFFWKESGDYKVLSFPSSPFLLLLVLFLWGRGAV